MSSICNKAGDFTNYWLAIQKDGEVESYQLPPYQDCQAKHALRVNYQAAIWRRSLQASPEIPNPKGRTWLGIRIRPRPNEMKWNESGFRPPLCTYRLNWARRTSWGWWDDWDDTVLQTQDSKFEPWRSEAEHATSRSRRLPTILTFTRGWGRNNFVSFKPPRPGTEPRTLAWKATVLTTTLGPPPRPRPTISHNRLDNRLPISWNCFGIDVL